MNDWWQQVKTWFSPLKKYELVRFRQLIRQLAVRDLKARYKVSVLGFFWSLLRPLLTIAVLAMVFSVLDFRSTRYDVTYPVLLLVTYMPWFYFATALMEGTNSLLSNAHLVKKVYCPRAVFPTAVVTANLVNFFFTLLVLLPVLYLITGAHPTWALLQLPMAAVVLTCFLLGLCYIASILNVIYRDTQQIMEFVVFVWFYVSPVLYDIYKFCNNLPPMGLFFYFLNPMAGLLEWFRYIFLAAHLAPDSELVDLPVMPGEFGINFFVMRIAIPYAIGLSLVMLFVGYRVLKRLEIRAVDEL